jgi:hypothetical protein
MARARVANVAERATIRVNIMKNDETKDVRRSGKDEKKKGKRDEGCTEGRRCVFILLKGRTITMPGAITPKHHDTRMGK